MLSSHQFSPSPPKRILIFAVIFIVFFTILPVFFGSTFAPFPLVQTAEVFEFLSVFFIVPAYWYVFEIAGSERSSRLEVLLFILFTALLNMADGLHLASNAIQHLIETTKGSPGHSLAYFLHKPFSHYGIAFALVGLSSVLIYRERKTPSAAKSSLLLETISALLYGFSFFGFTVSGKVCALGVPYAIAVIVLALLSLRKLRTSPILAFFGMAYAIYLLFVVAWAIRWKGLPNFDEVGMFTQMSFSHLLVAAV